MCFSAFCISSLVRIYLFHFGPFFNWVFLFCFYWWILRSLYTFWVQVLCWICDLQTFSHSQRLFFYIVLLTGSLIEQKLFNFDEVKFIIFSLYRLYFWCKNLRTFYLTSGREGSLLNILLKVLQFVFHIYVCDLFWVFFFY